MFHNSIFELTITWVEMMAGFFSHCSFLFLFLLSSISLYLHIPYASLSCVFVRQNKNARFYYDIYYSLGSSGDIWNICIHAYIGYGYGYGSHSRNIGSIFHIPYEIYFGWQKSESELFLIFFSSVLLCYSFIVDFIWCFLLLLLSEIYTQKHHYNELSSDIHIWYVLLFQLDYIPSYIRILMFHTKSIYISTCHLNVLKNKLAWKK